MSKRAARWVVFGVLWWTLPWAWPLGAVADPFIPAARYALLAAAGAWVAASEGAAGAAGTLVGVVTAWAVVTTLGVWILAWLWTRALNPVSSRVRLTATVTLVVVAIAAALWLAPYRTPFGRTPTAGLLDILS